MDILIAGKSGLTYNHHEHMHETWEIIVNTKGSGTFQFGSEQHPFSENTIVCIPPCIPHEKRSNEGYLDIWVQLSEFPSLDMTKPTFLTDDSDANIASLIKILYSVQYNRFSNREEVKESLIESIQQLILGRLSRTKRDPSVEEIMAHIIQNFHDPSFSIDKCLASAGYCTDHMRRLFREQVGKTPQQYLTYLRIKSAKKLLSARSISNYSVADICTMVGFNDVSYFSRVFKKATGCTPGEYVGKK